MMTMQQAQHIAQEWIDAWNAHDLDAIMAHYADDIEFWSPLIVQRLGIRSGSIRDKAQLRAYFARGLEAAPNLHFMLLKVFVGVDSLILYYRRQTGAESTEMMVVDEISQRVTMARAHYNPALELSVN